MAILMRLNIRKPTAVAAATGLPRYARNDQEGTHEKHGLRDTESTPLPIRYRRFRLGVILPLQAGLALPGAAGHGGTMIQSAVVQQLRQGGVRVTPQRLAIAEAVLNSSDHPTVQQIHERVQQHFPSMTLATVYSTLGVLSKSGLIQELPFAKQSRYESNVSPHVNLVCIGCGSIADADDSSDVILRLRDEVSSETNFQVMWQRVDFHGWCRSCSPGDA